MWWIDNLYYAWGKYSFEFTIYGKTKLSVIYFNEYYFYLKKT